MSQRIMTGMSAVMAACCILVVVIAWLMMKESQLVNYQMLEQLTLIADRPQPVAMNEVDQKILKELERLNQKQASAGNSATDEMNQISFQLVQDNKDKGPAVGFSGTLSKTGDKTDSFSVEAVSDDAGKLEFGRLPWGKYSFSLHAPWGEYFGTEISVIPGRKFSQTIVCPVSAAERVPVRFEVDWSDQLRSGDWLILCDFRRRSFGGGAVSMDRQVDRKTWWRSFSAQDWASQPQVCLLDRDNQVSSCPLTQNKEFAKVEFSTLEFQPSIHLEQASSYILPVVCLVKKKDLAKLPSLNENQNYLVLSHQRKKLTNLNPFTSPLSSGGFSGPLIPTPTTVLFPFEEFNSSTADSRAGTSDAQGIQLAKQLAFSAVKNQDNVWKFKLPEQDQLKIPAGLKPVNAY